MHGSLNGQKHHPSKIKLAHFIVVENGSSLYAISDLENRFPRLFNLADINKKGNHMKKSWVCAFGFILTFTAVAWASPVPDTGQTTCYDDQGNVITCPSPGQPFYGQDGNYNINPPSYTKLDGSGNALPDSATSWVTVRDNVTGLIWENKTSMGQGTNYSDPHNADNYYSWYDSNPATNGGNTGTQNNGKNTEAFIKALNDAHFGGYSDWRMPIITEMAYLVDYSSESAVINKVYFPNTQSSYYWSSNTDANNNSDAWCMNFSSPCRGSSNSKATITNNYFARAVRGGQSVSVYTDNEDGTVTDNSTGLMWQQATATTGTSGNYFTWKDALSYCDNLNLGGHTDWRMPNFKELQSLLDFSHYQPSINTNYFPDTKPYQWYWSSTSASGAWDRAFYLIFSNSFGSDDTSKGGSCQVRAVRGGQAQPAQACSATLNAALSLHIPYISYGNGTLSLWVDFTYNPNPSYPTLIPFKLTNYAIINNPSFTCSPSTLASDLTIHIPDVLLPNGVTHIWVDLSYSPALSTGGNFYWVVSNYGTVSN